MEVREPSAKYLARAGFKQTDIGVIPEDWEVDSLARYWNVMDCKHVTAQFIANGYPIASIKEVQNRFVDLTEANQTTQKFFKLLIEGGREPRIGDLILSRNATVGEVAQVAEWHPPFAMGQDVCLLRKRSPQYSTDFLQEVFRSSVIGNQLSDLMVGSTFKRANVQQIKNLAVLMPSPAEQEAIAEALTDADALITSLEHLLAKKRQIKQGAMQELLTGKKRLPGFSGEWKEMRVGDVAELLKGSGLSRAKTSTSGCRPCILYGELFTTYRRVIRPIVSRTDSDEGLPSVAGDVLMPGSTTTTGADLAIASALLVDNVALGGDINVIRRKSDSYDATFLANHLTHTKYRAITEVTQGITIHHLYGRDLKHIAVQLPSLSEQTAIAAILSDMDAEIAALEAKFVKARNLKQGMMQELLTGRIRLI